MSGRSGILRPLRERDFALLWAGQSVSLVGNGVFTVALALQALDLSGRPTALASVLAARALPRVLFLLIAGAVSDRLPRRRTAIVSDIARGLAVGAIAVLAASGELELWHLIVMAVVFGTADAFFLPTMTAIVPEILPSDLLVAGSGLTASTRHLGEQLIGPALGGLLVAAVGASWAFGLDAASFAVSAACLMAMRARPSPAAEPGTSILADAREGLRYTRSVRWLWVSLLAAGFGNFVAFSMLPVLMPLLVRDELGGGPAQLGLVYAGFGAGGGSSPPSWPAAAAPRDDASLPCGGRGPGRGSRPRSLDCRRRSPRRSCLPHATPSCWSTGTSYGRRCFRNRSPRGCSAASRRSTGCSRFR